MTGDGDPILSLGSLCAGYDGLAVVRDLTLDVAAGEVVALLGPNGAGKTTTLLTISGLLKPISGTLGFLGEDICGERPDRLVRRGLVQVPDDRGLFPGLTVVEHLGLAVPRSDRAAMLEQVFGWFPALEALTDRRAGLLSGGEQQMLALAQALLRRPRVLMIDEMSLGLAPIVVESLLPIVRQVAAETGCGVLLVEQHAPMALQVADKAVLLNHGDVVVSGPAVDLAADWDSLLSSYLG
jgi:branched-chain amino acid transport system ATP-binding protein